MVNLLTIFRKEINMNKDILNSNAKILSDMADISVEDATNMLLAAMKAFDVDNLSEEEANTIVDKLNSVSNS
jgi:hypothetical protein